MSDQIIEAQVVETNDALSQAQNFWQKYGKAFAIGFGAAVLAFTGVYAYKEYIAKPKEEKAADAIFKTQQYFAADSSKLVLDGDGVNKGALYVIKNFSGTKAANLAHFYAGISYLKLGDFAKAIEHLKDFSTDAKQIQMVAYGALADAYAESGKKDDAVEYYSKAGKTFEADEANSAVYLFRAGLLSETLNKNKEALEFYKELKAKFPKTQEASQVDKYINRISVEKPELSVN